MGRTSCCFCFCVRPCSTLNTVFCYRYVSGPAALVRTDGATGIPSANLTAQVAREEGRSLAICLKLDTNCKATQTTLTGYHNTIIDIIHQPLQFKIRIDSLLSPELSSRQCYGIQAGISQAQKLRPNRLGHSCSVRTLFFRLNTTTQSAMADPYCSITKFAVFHYQVRCNQSVDPVL